MRPLPASIPRLAAAIADAKTDIADVVSIVETDPALLASVIRQANSAASAPEKEITTVRAAVVRLGFGATLAAATAGALEPQTQSALPAYDLDIGEMWNHALTTMSVAEQIYRLSPVDLDPGVVTAALLHHLGQTLLNEVLNPRSFRQLVQQEPDFESAEREAIDLDHAEVGALLLELWQLPTVIVDAVRYHHQPETSERNESHAILASSILATEFLFELQDPHSASHLCKSLEALEVTETDVVEAVLAAEVS